MKQLDHKSIIVDNIDMRDYPDFVDAFIANAYYTDGIQLTDAELDELNQDSDFVYQCVLNGVT